MRIRSILPDFYRSEDIGALDWHDRLVFIGLWSYVDDNGVGRDNDRLITSDLFPLDGDPTESLRRVSTALDALARGGQIQRYKVGGVAYLFVTNWDKYQRVQNPGRARYPRPTCDNVEPTETLPRVSVDPPETLTPGEGEKGRRGEGEEGELLPSPAAPSRTTEPIGFPLFWEHYPRKVGKDAALKAWAKAVRRADPAYIASAAARYAADRNLPEPQFIPHPSKWLNDGRWDDPPLPPRTNGRPTDRQGELLRMEMARAQEADAATPPRLGIAR